MKDCSNKIRSAYYTALNGAVTYNTVAVPVYAELPKSATYPCICISNIDITDASDKSKYNANVNVSIDIITKFDGDGSNIQMDTIGSAVLQIVNARTKLTLTDFDLITCKLESANETDTLEQEFKYKIKTYIINNYITEK